MACPFFARRPRQRSAASGALHFVIQSTNAFQVFLLFSRVSSERTEAGGQA